MSDKQYLVQWEIDIYAESPEDAARQALEIQRDNDPANLATVFTVQAFDSNEDGVRVDLLGIVLDAAADRATKTASR